MKRSIVALLLWTATALPGIAQIQFEGTERVWSTDFVEAVEIANSEFEGALFVLAFKTDDDDSHRTAKIILGNDELREYLDANFSLVAVNMDSDDWSSVQKRIRGHYSTRPHVLIDVPKYTNSGSFEGWVNPDDDQSETLELIKEMKTRHFDGFGKKLP